MNRSMPNRSMLSGLLLAALLAGTVSAQFSETSTYNDEACQDLNNTLVINGILGERLCARSPCLSVVARTFAVVRGCYL